MEQICIFPIPDCVTFPGTLFPLHVFEPRYRQMINHCMATDMPVAICHTQKELSPGKAPADLKDALHSNQATYRPYDVFSAGTCKLRERLEDGRLLVDVHITERYRRVAEVQLLPYQVYLCEPVVDRKMSENELQACLELKDKIIHRLTALIPASSTAGDKLISILKSEEWSAKSVTAFSFELFGLIRFQADLLQNILEMDSPEARLNRALELLNS